MATLTLITDPPFVVDFGQFNPKEKQKISLRQKVQNAALGSIELVRIAFIATGKAGYVTLSYAGKSFKHIVLGYYGNLSSFRPPGDVYLAIFKVFIWVGGMAWCFTVTSIRLFRDQIKNDSADRSLLSQFAGDEIDLTHIQSKELVIDVSQVPSEVKVDQLIGMFDQINFDNPNLPGYMAPLSRAEGNVPHPVEGLKASLERFVDYVNRRQAFLATPPAYDTPRLFAFYQQIEDAVRFSIHKVESDLKKFQEINGVDLAGYSTPVLKKYKDLLEERARVPINLAIAGYHCGSRFMGESMSLYSASKGDGSISEGTLQDALIEILADKRSEIANQQIAIHSGHDTHDYTNYMANLGQLLAIPGTANVTEDYRTQFDRSRFLKLFFEEYTVDCIIDTVQEKIQKSQILREKITDWLRDQVGDWNRIQEHNQKLLEESSQILERADLDDRFPVVWNLNRLCRLISHLKNFKIQLPDPNQPDWDEFLAELFALKESHDWLQKDLSQLDLSKSKNFALAYMKRDLKSLFSNEQLGEELVQKVKMAISGEGELSLKHFTGRLLELQKLWNLRDLTHIHEGILERVVKGKKQIKEAIEEASERGRRSEFLNELPLDEIEVKGLTPEILEWILVSQNIFLPQGG